MSIKIGMTVKKGFTKDQRNKIGNSIIYFTDRIPLLSKTKLIKLLYLLEELSVKQYGIPFLNLDYKVWKLGPVNIDLFAELTQPDILKDYIKITRGSDGEYFIKTKKKFNDDEFSANEIKLMDEIIAQYGKYSARTLITICHKEGTLWRKIAEEYNLIDSFKKNLLSTTELSIELSDYIKEDRNKYSTYTDHLDFLSFSTNFKA